MRHPHRFARLAAICCLLAAPPVLAQRQKEPLKELRGFRRILLDPGATQTVTFTLTPDDLAFYDLEMERVVEPGFFKVFTGTSSADVQEARFEVVRD